VKLRELASVRCGDKGTVSNAVVVAYGDDAYALLAERLTADRLGTELSALVDGPVTRYELPHLNAFNFVIENALAGGVTTSLRMDGHGKSISTAVTGIEIDVPEGADVTPRSRARE
jgi:hypothetical protein